MVIYLILWILFFLKTTRLPPVSLICSSAHLMFPPAPFLLLLNQIRSRCWRRSSPHVTDYFDTVLRKWGEPQHLPFLSFHILKFLKSSKGTLQNTILLDLTTSVVALRVSYLKCPYPQQTASYQDSLPKQQQHLLHREVWGMATAEFGHHPKQHNRKWLIVIKWCPWKVTYWCNPSYIKMPQLFSWIPVPSSAISSREIYLSIHPSKCILYPIPEGLCAVYKIIPLPSSTLFITITFSEITVYIQAY